MAIFKSIARNVAQIVGVSIWVTSVLVVTFLILFTAVRFLLYGLKDTVALCLLVTQIVAMLLPLDTPNWGPGLIPLACWAGATYFPTVVKADDEDLLKPGRPYLLGYEPHSALPIATVIIAAPGSTLLPKALRNCHTVASSVAPIIRHLWWWLGVRPVSKVWMTKLLKQGKSVIVCPGGVQEVLYMEKGCEVVMLKRRRGFVRLAMQLGVPIVPVFAFGQTEVYSWYRPGPPTIPQRLVDMYSRAVGYVPLLLWGRWGTSVPHRHKMTIVIGKPIELPQTESPSNDEVDKYLQVFIHDLCDLFERHKAEAGYPSRVLKVL